MSPLELTLYKTRKTVLEALAELRDNNVSLDEIASLEQCNSCDIWLFPTQLIPDLDGLPICHNCADYYGL